MFSIYCLQIIAELMQTDSVGLGLASIFLVCLQFKFLYLYRKSILLEKSTELTLEAENRYEPRNPHLKHKYPIN